MGFGLEYDRIASVWVYYVNISVRAVGLRNWTFKQGILHEWAILSKNVVHKKESSRITFAIYKYPILSIAFSTSIVAVSRNIIKERFELANIQFVIPKESLFAAESASFAIDPLCVKRKACIYASLFKRRHVLITFQTLRTMLSSQRTALRILHEFPRTIA